MQELFVEYFDESTLLQFWSEVISSTSSPQIEKIKLPLRHAGQYADDESGLFYNYFRYYIPELGFYNRPDSLGLLLRNHDPSRKVSAKLGISLPPNERKKYLNHLYGYGKQSPLLYTDPNGEFWHLIPIVVVAVVVAILPTTCTETVSDACESKFPNHHIAVHPDHREYMACLAKGTEANLGMASAASDPIGTAATGVGEAIGNAANDD